MAASSIASWLTAHLSRLQAESCDDSYDTQVLWPNTPIGSGLQKQIEIMQGVSDRHPGHPQSRPATVLRMLSKLYVTKHIDTDFTLLDVLCGDGLILGEVRKLHRRATVCGFDANAGKFPDNQRVRRLGVHFYRGYLQRLIATDLPQPVDVVMMLNTFRGWHSAQLREHEQELPKLTEAWFWRNAHNVILTVNDEQHKRFEDELEADYDFSDWGPGEEGSRFVLLTRR